MVMRADWRLILVPLGAEKEYLPPRGRLIFYEDPSFAACKLAHLGTLGSSDTWHRNWQIGPSHTLESFIFLTSHHHQTVCHRNCSCSPGRTKPWQPRDFLKMNAEGNPMGTQPLVDWRHRTEWKFYCLSCCQPHLKYLLSFQPPSCAQNLQNFLWKVLHPNFSCINYRSIFGPDQSTVETQCEIPMVSILLFRCDSIS